jgi:DNA-binding FrmR family transcriptional regulator
MNGRLQRGGVPLDKYPVGVYNGDRTRQTLEGENMEEQSCCRKKAVPRTEEERTRLVHRLNRIEGQIRGIRGMLEEDRYCIDILTQVSAAGSALNCFSRELLSQHLKTCVAQDVHAGNEEKLNELTGI